MKLRERGSAERTCPLCRDALAEIEASRCSSCRTTYHAECRAEIGRCPTLGCTEGKRPRRPPPIEVSPLEVAATTTSPAELRAPPDNAARRRILGWALVVVGVGSVVPMVMAGFLRTSAGILLITASSMLSVVAGLALAWPSLLFPAPDVPAPAPAPRHWPQANRPKRRRRRRRRGRR